MSRILQYSTHFLSQIMLLLSILLLFRGHNYPGGGFIGALVASATVALYSLAYRIKTSKFDKVAPIILAVGILILLLAFIAPLFYNHPPLTGMWLKFSFITVNIKLGTPLLFDIGIYFTVIGGVTWLIAELEDI